MRKRPDPNIYLTVILIAAILFSLLAVYATSAAGSNRPSVSARAATLYEPETGSFLFEKNSCARLPMASTTKIMTALIAIEECDLADTVIIDPRAVGTEGSSAYLRENDIYTVEELLYALLLQSANDAAVALAYHIGGGIDEFAEVMNSRAEMLGLCDTSFKNPHGLDAEDHYTTARELALITAAALNNPIFSQITSTYKKTFKQEERTRTYVNHNKLLKRYEGCIGVKTGFTKKCGRCLVSAAERNGLTFIAVTLNAPDDWKDHETLLDLGYSSLERLTLALPYEYRYSVRLLNGDTGEVGVTNNEGFSIIVPKGVYETDVQTKLFRFAKAPVKQNEEMGRLYFTLNGDEVGSIPLVAEKDVKRKK